MSALSYMQRRASGIYEFRKRLSAEGFKLINSFSAFELSFPADRPSTIRWKEHIKIANLPL